MSKVVGVISTLVALAAVFVTYLAFVAHEFVQAWRADKLIGAGVFPIAATRPGFLIVAAVVFALAFYEVAH